jgi:hypothetical protein
MSTWFIEPISFIEFIGLFELIAFLGLFGRVRSATPGLPAILLDPQISESSPISPLESQQT